MQRHQRAPTPAKALGSSLPVFDCLPFSSLEGAQKRILSGSGVLQEGAGAVLVVKPVEGEGSGSRAHARRGRLLPCYICYICYRDAKPLLGVALRRFAVGQLTTSGGSTNDFWWVS